MSSVLYLKVSRYWSRLPLLLRGFLVLLMIAALTNWGILWRLRHRSQIRHKFTQHAQVTYGPSSVPPVVERRLDQLVPHPETRLFAPFETATLREPSDTSLEDIAEFHSMKQLSVTNGRLTEQGLAHIRHLNQLESLYLENVSFEAEALSGLQTCDSLQQLKLVGPLTPEALRPLSRCRALTELQLDAGFYEHRKTESLTKRLTGHHLDAVARIPNLKRLTIRSNDLSDTDLRPLANAGRLEELFVDTVMLKGDALNSLGKLPRLKQLILEVSDADPAALQRLNGFPALQVLALRGAAVQSAHLTHLRNLNRLETLCLRGATLGKSLEPITRLTRLKHLNLFLAELPPDGLQQLERLEHLQELCLGVNDATARLTSDELRQKFPVMLNVESKLTVWNQRTDIPKWEGASTSHASGTGGGFF